MTTDKTIWVSKSVLARHLKLGANGRQIVHNWAIRKKVKSIFDKKTGQTLVQKINKIPTNDRRVKSL